MLSSWVKNSPTHRRTWKTICSGNHLKDTLLRCDVATRWNSIYDMIEQALELKARVTLFLRCHMTFPNFIDPEWHFLEQVWGVLKKSKQMTNFVSQATPTINCAVPLYYSLHDTLHDASDRIIAFSGLGRKLSKPSNLGLKKNPKNSTISWAVLTLSTPPWFLILGSRLGCS